MEKKGLAMNMTILLVISLIVLVILGILIARSSSTYTKSTSCKSAGGECVKSTECEGSRSSLSGCEKDQICCISIKGG